MPPELMTRFRLGDRTLNFRALHRSTSYSVHGVKDLWVVEHEDWALDTARKPGEYRVLAEIDPAWAWEDWVRTWMYWVHDYETER